MRVLKDNILSTVGGTPLVKLSRAYDDLPVVLYGKLEMFNPGGSVKDRPAHLIVSNALRSGQLQKGATVVESSSGNMAIGLAQECCYHGLRFIAVVDPKINPHTEKVLQTYGARIEKVTEPDADGNYLKARLQRVQALVSDVTHSFWPNQYANKANPAAHVQTMAEIVAQTSGGPDYLLAATSTCGTIMGCAHYAKQQKLKTKIVAVDAVGSVIFGAPAADRLVPGHGAGRPSELLDRRLVDHVIHINDQECVAGAHRLLNREAILAGGSSGAVISAVQKLQPQLPDGASCVLILPDSGERYLDTVYNEDWLNTHFGNSHGFKSNYDGHRHKHSGGAISSSTYGCDGAANGQKKKSTRKIAIIGGGPKGTYGFERLAAEFNARPADCNVEIHVFNKSSHFGAGDIYRPGQPPYLLVNNPIGDINMWIGERPQPVAPGPLPLTKWLQKKKKLDVAKDDYVPRGLVGEYLQAGFEAIARYLPENVTGRYFVAEVTDIRKERDKYILQVLGSAGNATWINHRYDHILLATGHPCNKLTQQEKEFQRFAEGSQKIDYVPFIYPVESSFANIGPAGNVGIKGIGLTFIDAVLALTEGRGGIFERISQEDKLSYQPSGGEPQVIYPFSRSGMPMIPRGPAPQHPADLKFFTTKALNRCKQKAPNGKLSFRKQLLPLLYREMVYAFHNTLMKQNGFYDDLQSCATFAEVQHYINAFYRRYPKAERFDPELFLKPLNSSHFKNPRYFHEGIKAYLKFFIAEARKGELRSPWAAAGAVWRKATPLFGTYYEYGGLKPSSQKFFDTQFRRLLDRVTFGPPIESMEKVLALMEIGKLDFTAARNPELEIDRKNTTFILNLGSEEIAQPVEYLVDARIANVSIEDNQSPLYRNLLQQGLLAKYKNEQPPSSYQPGCAALSPGGFAMDSHGLANRSLALTGTPTEGVTFDNDALSRTRNNFVSEWAASIRRSYAPPAANHHLS